MSRKRRFPEMEDEALWRSIVEGITPLPKRKPAARRAAAPPGMATGPPPRAIPAAAQASPARSAPPNPRPLETGSAPDMDRRTAERLRRGQMPIDLRVDLHGLTREEAHRALLASLDAAWRQGRRVVLVITGKGQGILRDAVPRWLNEGENRRRILAFCHAQPRDGGSGALYVLLKRRR